MIEGDYNTVNGSTFVVNTMAQVLAKPFKKKVQPIMVWLLPLRVNPVMELGPVGIYP